MFNLLRLRSWVGQDIELRTLVGKSVVAHFKPWSTGTVTGNKKQQVSNDNNSSSNEEICITHCRKKAKCSANADEKVNNKFEEPDIEEVKDEDNGPISGGESDEVL